MFIFLATLGNAAAAEPEGLIEAIRAGDAGRVESLLQAGADPSEPLSDSGLPPLFEAVRKGHAEIVWMLLNAGEDVNATYHSDNGGSFPILSDAIHRRHSGIAIGLIDRDADIDGYECPPDWPCTPVFILAVQYGDSALVRRFVEAGASVDLFVPGQQIDGMRRDEREDDTSPLMTAAMMGRPDILAVLLEMGADVSLKTRMGCTAIDLAIINKRPKAAELLRKAGSVADEKGCYMYRYLK
ncbi:MAG: ankyrin repeat domain-containing protein [Alphaproteobacteria bacterium]|nr:ankyrin repeat domain-containing protein [Alphaproteobacteria bacterium]